MDAVSLAFRCVLTVVFVIAAVGKLLDRQGSSAAVEGFGVPRSVARVAGPVLPIVELLVAVALVFSPTAVVGAGGALLLLIGFAAGISRAMLQGNAPDCHCFGQIHSEPAGLTTLVRNGLLAALAVTILADQGGHSFAAVANTFSGTEIGLGVASLVAAVLALATVQLWSDRRRIGAELEEALKARRFPGLPRGVPAPMFDLEPVRGETGALADIMQPGLPTVLVFASTTCGPCLQMFPTLSRWQDSISHSVTLLAVLSGQRADVDRLCEEHELRPAVAQASNEMFETYALRATPSGVLIDSDGVIAGAPAEGVPAIEALIRTALSGASVPATLDIIPAG
jgi:thiol-disulfide isomerase/thioredoxin